MRMPMILLLAAIAVLQVPGWAEGKSPTKPGGGGFVGETSKASEGLLRRA
jgi:hypothetical protein